MLIISNKNKRTVSFITYTKHKGIFDHIAENKEDTCRIMITGIKKVNGYLLDAIIICTFATNKGRHKSHLMTKKVPSAMEQAD